MASMFALHTPFLPAILPEAHVVSQTNCAVCHALHDCHPVKSVGGGCASVKSTSAYKATFRIKKWVWTGERSSHE
jgi:hypothetical protein